jgi:XcyI restriction endonuclease
MSFNLPPPDLQVGFALKLIEARTQFLQDALKATVTTLDIAELDRQLAKHAPRASLTMLASHGLRGELVFPVPLVLEKNPRLLGYYRLLYGYSQKSFYTPATGMGQFKAMEKRGSLTARHSAEVSAMCVHLGEIGALLLAGVGSTAVSDRFIDDLTLLTLGPQLRGSANVKVGTEGIEIAFGIIREIIRSAIVAEDSTKLKLKNAAGREVSVRIAADPDIKIEEVMGSGAVRHLIAVEVKGGRDFSNIHNRVGEAEKSHQKARASGFTECWTIVNVDRTDFAKAKCESPSTDRFYRLSDLIDQGSKPYQDFRDRIQALTGT